MDARLFSAGVAKINSHYVPAEDSSDMLVKKIWRWLEAVHDREPPKEQPAFDGDGEPLHPIHYEPYRTPVFREVKQQARSKQSQKSRMLTEAPGVSGLPEETCPYYGKVQILRRPLARNGSQDRKTQFRADSTQEKHSVPPPLAEQEKQGKAAQRTVYVGGFEAGDPSCTMGIIKADPVEIDCTGKSVPKWVQRIQANSRSATRRLLKRTK